MPQHLYFGGDYLVEVERMFRDQGQTQLLAPGPGGTSVLYREARAPYPSIMQSGQGFFYENYAPVKPGDVIDHVPEPYRSMCRIWAEHSVGKPVQPVFVPTERQKRALLDAQAAGLVTSTMRPRERPPGPQVDPNDPEVAAWLKQRADADRIKAAEDELMTPG
jgi:hypothetical protein